jgi:Domain of unknown function (DUF4386)
MNTTRTHASDPTPMTATRKAALVAGIAYIATFVFSIPVKFGLWVDVLDKPDWVLGAGSDSGVPLGAMFEILTAIGGVVTAVALFSVARRHGERGALGFVTSRVMEAVVIFVGVLAIMANYTLRHDVAGTAGADTGALRTVGQALVAVHDWTFLIGPGIMPALNALFIATIMYRSRMLPRWIPTFGLVGAPLLLISSSASLFGAWDQISGPAVLFALPIAIWEFSFGIYMMIKGFKPSDVNETTAALPAPRPSQWPAPDARRHPPDEHRRASSVPDRLDDREDLPEHGEVLLLSPLSLELDETSSRSQLAEAHIGRSAGANVSARSPRRGPLSSSSPTSSLARLHSAAVKCSVTRTLSGGEYVNVWPITQHRTES